MLPFTRSRLLINVSVNVCCYVSDLARGVRVYVCVCAYAHVMETTCIVLLFVDVCVCLFRLRWLVALSAFICTHIHTSLLLAPPTWPPHCHRADTGDGGWHASNSPPASSPLSIYLLRARRQYNTMLFVTRAGYLYSLLTSSLSSVMAAPDPIANVYVLFEAFVQR